MYIFCNINQFDKFRSLMMQKFSSTLVLRIFERQLICKCYILMESM